MPKIGVVIHTPLRDALFSPEDQARLSGLAEVVWTESPKPLSTEAAIALLRDCDIGVGSWQTPFPTPELLAGCPRLALWEHAAGTVRHMFGPHMRERALQIASCKSAIADCVAEMALAEIILGLRGVFPNAAANRLGPAPKPVSCRALFGATVGVVGASEVGKSVLQLLRSFSCQRLLYDPYVPSEAAKQWNAEWIADLTELCARSDVVTLHTPDLPTTRGLMGAAQFQAMRDDAIFINTSRGNCVDEAALIAELEKGRLFAFLDVSAPEPAAADSPLRRLPNVVYTSHIAGPPAKNIGKQAVDDIAAFLAGGTPRCLVREDDLDRVA
jgi:phosphoglycerate dehydrogenase-like enzyme